MELTWFAAKEDIQMDKFEGKINLSHIFEVAKISDQNGNPAFFLGFSMYEKRHKKEAGKRDFTFTCATQQDRDRWVAAIDYLKTRSIYLAYAKKNKLVSLGLSSQKIKHEDQANENSELDVNELLYDFGQKFRQSTHVGPSALLTSHSNFHSKTLRHSQFPRLHGSVTMRRETNASVAQPKAPDLVQKLNLLYKVGMTSFLHHLDRKQLRNNNIVGVNHS